MSKKVPLPDNVLQEVRVDVTKPKKQSEYDRRNSEFDRRKSEYDGRKSEYDEKKTEQRHNFVYVNPAYVGSMHSVNERAPEPPTSVIREQYWACSRWPYGQKILAGVVGLLVGTVIGLALTMSLRSPDSDTVIGGIFRST